jgi:replicative DNA helicase
MEKDSSYLLGMEMPYSLEAEQSVLGAVLVEPSCLPELIDKLKPESFYRPQHRAIFTIMIRMFTSGGRSTSSRCLSGQEDEVIQNEHGTRRSIFLI